MGNLNKFYLLGRVAKAPVAEGADDARVAKLWLTPGTQGGRRRGAGLPVLLHAYGPQVEAALELKVGQGVLARGQLRQETRGDGEALVAQVQALELLAGRPRRPRPEGGEEPVEAGEDGRSGKRRRRRRRGPRKPEGEGGAQAEGEAPKPAKPVAPVVPPEPPPVAPPPDPSYTSDIPF